MLLAQAVFAGEDPPVVQEEVPDERYLVGDGNREPCVDAEDFQEDCLGDEITDQRSAARQDEPHDGEEARHQGTPGPAGWRGRGCCGGNRAVPGCCGHACGTSVSTLTHVCEAAAAMVASMAACER